MNSWEFYSRIEMFKHSQKDDELAHYGITGQKWGRRRWQNADGTFNAEGKERYFGTKSKKENSSDTGVKDYIKYKNGSSDQKQKFGGRTENNDISDRANKIYKKYKPNEWRRILNTSDLSTEDAIKIENELNKKLYKEDKHYAKIVNNENVKNALKEYIDSWDDVIKESNRIYSKEFMDNNPEAKNWDGDGTEYWHKFADKDIANKDKESYWKLRETVSSLSRKHGKWDHEMLDKVMSDLTEPVNDTTDESSKAYDKIKEHTGIDFREPSQKFGSTGYINWKQLDESNRDSYGKSEEQYWKDKEKAEKYLDENYDKDFAQVIKDDYDTGGEWGDVDTAYEQFKENPYEYLKKYSRDPKYNLSPKEEKALQKEAKKLEKEFTSKYGNHEFISSEKIKDWLNKDENKEIVDNYMDTYDKNYNKMSKELKEIFKDYEKDENGYISKAGLYEAIESGDSNLLYLFGTMDWFLGDDGDQGSRNSKSYYLQDKGNTMEDIKSLYNHFDDVQGKAANESHAALQKEPIYNYLNDDVQRHVDNALFWMYNKKDDYTYSKMIDAVDGLPRDKKIVNEVDKISKKLAPSCGDKNSYGWWYVSKAIENLNLESLDYKDLTDADWNRINDEINKIKKDKGGKL